MRAIRVHEFGVPEVMQVEELPDPHPGPGQVLVEVRAIGVNPVETYLRAGQYGRGSLPFTPGTDAAGVIEAVGEGVKGLAAGARVYTAGTLTGAYASKCLCEAGHVHPLPENVTFPQGAAVNIPYGTAYRGLFQRGEAAPPEVVLVHGASGGVGVAAVQLACAAGLIVIGTASSDEGRALAAFEGAQHVLDHTDPQHFRAVLDLTDGKGVDVIIELKANANLGEDLKILARRGRVVVIGARGPVEINPGDMMGREADVRGVMYNAATEKERAGIHAALVAGLANGALRPVIRKELPLAEAPRAHREVMEEKHAGKVVLIP